VVRALEWSGRLAAAKYMSRKHSKQNIENAFLTLAEASRDELAAVWTSRNGHAPLKGCGRTLLELAEGYAIQSSAHGGLKPSLRRKLGAMPNGILSGVFEHKVQKSRRLSQGSKLVREWNGRTHHVDVVQGGFVWNGSKHQSLSAIAKEITGAHWSGPRFFGL
jgi:Protein of unknown function (DUF2924)